MNIFFIVRLKNKNRDPPRTISNVWCQYSVYCDERAFFRDFQVLPIFCSGIFTANDFFMVACNFLCSLKILVSTPISHSPYYREAQSHGPARSHKSLRTMNQNRDIYQPSLLGKDMVIDLFDKARFLGHFRGPDINRGWAFLPRSTKPDRAS